MIETIPAPHCVRRDWLPELPDDAAAIVMESRDRRGLGAPVILSAGPPAFHAPPAGGSLTMPDRTARPVSLDMGWVEALRVEHHELLEAWSAAAQTALVEREKYAERLRSFMDAEAIDGAAVGAARDALMRPVLKAEALARRDLCAWAIDLGTPLGKRREAVAVVMEIEGDDELSLEGRSLVEVFRPFARLVTDEGCCRSDDATRARRWRAAEFDDIADDVAELLGEAASR